MRRYYITSLWRISVFAAVVCAVLLIGGVIWWGALLLCALMVVFGMAKAWEQTTRHHRRYDP